MIFFIEGSGFMRGFEKVSFIEFAKYYGEDKGLYDEYMFPKRSTTASAGYDFFAIKDFVIKPGEILKIPTGYKAKFGTDEVMLLVVRSSMGFKYNVRMCNQVGVIDSDYYNNIDNEGHILVALQNEGDKDYVIKKGQSYTQAIFMKYLMIDNDLVNIKRTGGIGSSNRKEDL